MYVYCLFCQTARCEKIAELVRERMGYRAIYPKQVQHTRSKGKIMDIEHALLPGYIFVYSDEKKLEISRFRALEGVLRCLCDDRDDPELHGDDEAFAMMMLEKDGVLGKTQVYYEGQMIRVCQGAFSGLETRVLKVNRRNMRIQIEIPFASRQVKTWVEYEVVQEKA